MIWAIVAIVGILAPFCFAAYEKWLKAQKTGEGERVPDDYVARLVEAEDKLENAHRRIENLEAIVVTRLLEDPSEKEIVKVDLSETIAQNIPK